MDNHRRQPLTDAFENHQRGNLQAAEAAYRLILRDHPGTSEAAHLLGLLLHQQGKNGEAVAQVMEAIAESPFEPLYRASLGDIFLANEEYDRATDCYRRVLAMEPGSVDALEGLGRASKARGEIAAALEWFRKAVEADPTRAQTYFLLGKAFMDSGQTDAAHTCYQAGLRLEPESAEGLGYLGELFAVQRRLDEAVACFRAALAHEPELVPVLNNLGNALKDQGHVQEALDCYRDALRLAPEHPDIHRNRAIALASVHRFEEAIQEFDATTALRPDDAEAHTKKALLLLTLGRFEKGWSEYQWRFKVNDPAQPVDTREFAQPLWDGTDLHGKRILVRAEQGAGDMFQFSRYLVPLKNRGCTVIFECPSRLSRLLGGLEGADIVVPKLPVPAVPFDVHVPLLSLPGFLGPPMEFLPLPVPYLHAPVEVAGQAKRLVDTAGLKVGICWQGNPQYKGDRERSVALSEFLPLIGLPGVRVFSLQKGYGREQLGALPDGTTVTDLGSIIDCGPDAFLETAAVIEHLDLIITTDTALPHLAGAMGRPVWLLVSRIPEWRWLLDRDDSPWYPTMRIFRQDVAGDWAGAFAKVTEALKHVLAGESPLLKPGRHA
jgi:tetratricopeptide (TPR) repeat protein